MFSFQRVRNVTQQVMNPKPRVLTRTIMKCKRYMMTESIEPPLSSLVPEKPCCLVLVEDQNLYATSFSTWLRAKLPQEHGIHFLHQRIPFVSLEASLSEMTNDLDGLPSVVLLARGPAVSWVAQYYLESLPLAGLIMVDPVVDDVVDVPSSMELLETLKSVYTKESCGEVALLDRIHSGKEERPLKLEPGAIPMLVLSSLDVLHRVSEAAARRHSSHDSPSGEVHIQRLPLDVDPSGLINDWIDQVVL